jgi:hypothetical protein
MSPARFQAHSKNPLFMRNPCRFSILADRPSCRSLQPRLQGGQVKLAFKKLNKCLRGLLGGRI